MSDDEPDDEKKGSIRLAVTATGLIAIELSDDSNSGLGTLMTPSELVDFIRQQLDCLEIALDFKPIPNAFILSGQGGTA